MRRAAEESVEPSARALAALEADGCRFAGALPGDVRLTEAGLGVWADYLRWATPCVNVEVYRETASTQDAARRGVEQRLSSDAMALIVADRQSAGRGRLGRRWVAPKGAAALMSVVMPAPDGRAERLNLAAAVAVAEAVDAHAMRSSSVSSTAIKWPNDVMRDGRKLAGVLVETVNHHGSVLAIVGIGINVFLSDAARSDLATAEPGLEQRVTSVAGDAPSAQTGLHRLALMADVVNGLVKTSALSDDALSEAWRRRCQHLGSSPVTYENQGRHYTGIPIDVDPQAGLILRMDSGEIVRLPSATTTAAVP